MRKITFVNTAHLPLDDRTFYHQALSLLTRGWAVAVISSKQLMNETVEGIVVDSFDDRLLGQKQKVASIRSRLDKHEPDVIICDTPIAVIAASACRGASVVYDITEWYPSKKNLTGLKGVKRWLKALALLLLNLYAGLLADKFIFGEYYKARPFKLLFWKCQMSLPYYPKLDYIRQYPLKDFSEGINLLYSGPFNKDKGIYNVLNVVAQLGRQRPELQICLQLITSFANEEIEQQYRRFQKIFPENVRVVHLDYLPFKDYCRTIGDCHLFLDLRQVDAENTRCLPIKLFYYLACGRPVVYSDLKAIRKEVRPFNFGGLVNPEDTEHICRFIVDCIDHPDRYREYAENAHRAAEEKYNWNALEREFVEFVLR